MVCQVFIFSRSEVSAGEFDCWGRFAEPWGLKAYITWMTVAVFVLPALIITICQVIRLASQSLPRPAEPTLSSQTLGF